MEVIKTDFEGVFLIKNVSHNDNRGLFTKVFNKRIFKENNLNDNIFESYFTISKKDVIRGMHFQIPPHDHEKMVVVPKGEIEDVILDLRKQSKTFGKVTSFILNDENKYSFFLPKGIAHGYKSNLDNTIVLYYVTTDYSPESEISINYDTIGFDWKVENPIISEKDIAAQDYKEFSKINPF